MNLSTKEQADHFHLDQIRCVASRSADRACRFDDPHQEADLPSAEGCRGHLLATSLLIVVGPFESSFSVHDPSHRLL